MRILPPDQTGGSRDELTDASEAMVRLGAMMLAAGSGSFRVEEAMRQAAASLGIQRVDAQVGYDQLVVSSRRGERVDTLVRQVYRMRIDASRLEALENLADSLTGPIAPAELEARLDQISRHVGDRWSFWIRTLASGIGCATFALLNDFTVGDALVVMMAAALGQATHLKLSARWFNPYGAAAIASVVACVAFAGLGWLADASRLPVLRSVGGPGFVAALLFLVPGYPMVTSLLELARSDFLAGLPRMVHSLGIIGATVVPAWGVAAITGMRPLTGNSPLPPGWRATILLLSGWVGMACFALLFNSSRRMILAAASLGTLCYLLRMVLGGRGLAAPACAACGALAVGLVTAFLAPRLHVPRSTLLVPASLIMVPGARLARTVYWLGVPDLGAAASNGVAAFGTVLAIAGGLAFARLLTDPDWAVIRPRPAPHAFRTGGGGSHAA